MEAERAKAHMLVGEPYARLINAASFAPTCGTFVNDLVRKHLEIPALRGTCLVTEQSPTVVAAGFVDLENCVFADETNVVEKLEHLFVNQNELKRVTSRPRTS